MKLAIAQIDAHVGDIEGICSRVFDQATLAAKQGTQMLCVPAPLLTGLAPTALINYGNFEHSLLFSLKELARRLEPLDVVCLIPAVVSYESMPVLEIFMLREGNAIPVRSFLASQRGLTSENAWVPPVFDVAGTRVAVTFDLRRDIESVPCGTDLFVYFQINGFSTADEATVSVASIRDGYFVDDAAKSGMWIACVSPVGAFEESIYPGGSFVMDDAGRTVACAPCFEESLLQCEVQRGMDIAHIEEDALPRYCTEEWLWGSLCLHVRSVAAEHGSSRVMVPLEGDLPSSLLAALAVDALGPRNVVGLLLARQDMVTSAQEAYETKRLAVARETAANLHIRLIERELPSLRDGLDSDTPNGSTSTYFSADGLRHRMSALLLSAAAEQEGACALAPFSKTTTALAASMALDCGAAWCASAPFGDVYLTQLEFLARWRNCRSLVVPERLVCLRAVESVMGQILAFAVHNVVSDYELADKIAAVLLPLNPTAIDGVLEAHVDRNCSFEDISLAAQSPEAVRALLLLTQDEEASRAKLPLIPTVSARAFDERIWPRSLGWSDFGRSGADLLTVGELVAEEETRAERDGADSAERVQNELMGFLGSLFGISPDQIKQAAEGDTRSLENGLKGLESKMRQMFDAASGQGVSEEDSDSGSSARPDVHFSVNAAPVPGPQIFRFFSQN